MNVIIHDLDGDEFNRLFPEASGKNKIISRSKNPRHCIGCFGCWIKTPGRCVIADGYERTGEDFAAADTVSVISRCRYGGYSPFVKLVWDRSISNLLPFFSFRDGVTRHRARYDARFNLSVYFYGADISDSEKQTAERMVRSNALSYLAPQCAVLFFDSPEKMAKEIRL